MNYQSEHEERHAAFDAMKLRKHLEYRPRLERVIDGVAWCNGHEIPNDDDYREGAKLMDAEYMALFASPTILTAARNRRRSTR